ncbi:MAG TPA: YcaO-like family protein [Gaiella sp.]|jgi:ribosomal protein S12 methylthiotransferase accessory factor
MTLAETHFTPLGDSLRRLDEAVSPLVGIVRHTVTTMHAPDETPLSNCASELASTLRTLGALTVEFGSGAHPSPEQARAAAIGEALERYSAALVPTGRICITTARALGAAAVAPSRFGLFHAQQYAEPGFPFTPFTPDTPTSFVEGTALADGSAAALPAELVYLHPPPTGTRPIGYATSSGLACGPSFGEAALAALLELVERDAVMVTWSNRLSLPLLRWDGDRRLETLDRRFFAVTGLRYSVVDASALLDVPVALGVLHGPPASRAALAVGAGCAAHMSDAWLKALSEAFGVYRWLGLQRETEPSRPLPCREDVRTFDDHMLFYATHERARLASFLDASPARTSPDDARPLAGNTPREQLGAVLERLEHHGVSAYAIDVTAPDVESLGLRVVRVLAPELCALDVAHSARFLGCRRLYTAAFDAGLAQAVLEPSDLNDDPHPFP